MYVLISPFALLGCPSRIYNDSRLTIGALYLDIFPIQDQAQCCKRCEANPDCDIWAFPNSRICSLMSLRAKTEVQYVVDPGSTFGLILGRKAGVAAWSNVVPLPPVICHDWQDRMQAFFTKVCQEIRRVYAHKTFRVLVLPVHTCTYACLVWMSRRDSGSVFTLRCTVGEKTARCSCVAALLHWGGPCRGFVPTLGHKG